MTVPDRPEENRSRVRAGLAGHSQELSRLTLIAAALNRSVGLDAALETTLEHVADLFALETGWIWLLDEKSGHAYLAAARNLPPALRDNPVRMTGGCYCLDSFHAGQMDGAANLNTITCSRLKGLTDGTRGLRHHASVPLYARDGEHLGILNVASRDWRQVSQDELDLLHTVGDLLSIAVERARLYDRSVELGSVQERNRLAREIHDTLAQTLSGLTLQLEALDAMLDAQADPQELRAVVARSLDLARKGLEDARRSVLDLRAAPLQGRSLAGALRELAEEQSRSSGVAIRFESVDADRPLPARIEAGVYRMAQEAVTNAIKHARPGHIAVGLTVTPAGLRLRVSDNGLGFAADSGNNPDDTADGTSDDTNSVDTNGQRFGLKGIQERARLLKGRMRLESLPGAGTSLHVDIPLEE